MPDCKDPDGLSSLDHLIDDAICADAQGTKPPEPASQRVPSEHISSKGPDRILDGIEQRPIERRQLPASSRRDADPRHGSALGPAFGHLGLDLFPRNPLSALELSQALLYGRDRFGVGEDLRRLL